MFDFKRMSIEHAELFVLATPMSQLFLKGVKEMNLTELELDEHYYLKLKNGKTEVQKIIGGFVLRNDDEIAEVLGKVPSYEEWQRIFHYASKYEHEYTSCAMDYENLKEENTKLKELLKECRDKLDTYYEPTIKKINQVLGDVK